MNYLVNFLVLFISLIGHKIVDCGQYYGINDVDYHMPNSLLHNFIERMNEDQQLQQQSYMAEPVEMPMVSKDSYPLYSDLNNYRIRKDLSDQMQPSDELLNRYHLQTRDDILLQREPVPRKEYLEHSSLYGHQYVQGGAGEGSQRLKPDGSIPNVQVIKSDSVLPAYCNPPNPCPVGYTAEDGCLEDFENSADYSKEYQASQECMCDSEHMFNCPGNTDENELETLARSIQNEGIELDSTIDKIMDTIDTKDHKVVAKKYFLKRSKRDNAAVDHKKSFKVNPYLTGEKLPVVAKKSPRMVRQSHHH